MMGRRAGVWDLMMLLLEEGMMCGKIFQSARPVKRIGV